MSLSEPVLHLRLVDIASNPHIVSLYNSLQSVLPEAVWWVTDETLGRIPFPVAPATPFCSEALLDEELRKRRIQEGERIHSKPPRPGETFPCCPGYCQGVALFKYREKSLGGIGLCHVPESRAGLLANILTLLNGYLNLVSQTLEGNDDLELVHTLWSETISVLDLSRLLRRVMDGLRRILSVRESVILLLDEDGMFYAALADGVDPEPLHHHPPGITRYDYVERIDLLFRRRMQCLAADDPLRLWFNSRLPVWAEGEILAVPFFRNEYLIGLFAAPVERSPDFLPSRRRLLDLYSTGAATALDNAAIFRRMHERRLALSTIHTVHRLMSSTGTLQDLLSRVTQQARQLLKAGKCSIILYDEERKHLVPRYTWGLEEQEVGFRAVVPGVSLVGWVAESYEAFIYDPSPDNRPPWKDNGDQYPDRSYLAVPLIGEDLEGVLLLAGREERFSPGDREILITLAEQIVIAIHNTTVREGERRITINALRGIANLLERGDPSTSGWTADICDLCDKLADRFGLSASDREDLTYASLLCHSGLLRFANRPFSTLERPTRVDRRISCEIIRSLGLPHRIAEIVAHADDWFSGHGAPDGLVGEAIPVASRILSVAAAYVSMTTPGMRARRDASPHERALAILEKRAGEVYDPRVIAALSELAK